MIIYRLGKIIYKTKTYLLFESGSTGYKVICANLDRFEEGKTMKLYMHEYRNEYTNMLYGFFEFKEKILFEDLISINGIGPKIAIDMIDQDWKQTASLIVAGNSEALSKFRYVGSRLGRQIVFEFQQKWTKLLNNIEIQDTNKTLNSQELTETLKMLRFKNDQINFAINNVKKSENLDDMIEEAITILTSKTQQHASNT